MSKKDDIKKPLESADNIPKNIPVAVDAVAEAERVKYQKMWGFDEYREGSPGYRKIHTFIEQCSPDVHDTIGDFGCGSAKASLELRNRGFKVQMVDIANNCLNDDVRLSLLPGWLDFTEACLWDLPATLEPVDWLYCCDVMEHIPEEKVDAVLKNLKAKMVKGGFFNIATYHERFGELINDTLHLTVKEPQWWLDKLGQYFRLVELKTTELDLSVAVYPKE